MKNLDFYTKIKYNLKQKKIKKVAKRREDEKNESNRNKKQIHKLF